MKKFKTASKKRGDLMEVVTDPNYGVDTRGDFKGKVFMPSGEVYDSNEMKEREKQQAQEFATIDELESSKIDDFNNNLLNDPLYEKLSIIADERVLVRMTKAPLFTKSGLRIPTNIPKPLKSGMEGVDHKRMQEHPFRFNNYGVVVNTSSTKLKRGDKVIINPKALEISFNRVIDMYEPPLYAFKHPLDTRDDYNELGYLFIYSNDIIATYEN